ncbi:hypothetical protein QFZ68_003369 [Streptomyces sp. V1I6]|nr:hypothetical protein [Streptomyces sp. V1I6]
MPPSAPVRGRGPLVTALLVGLLVGGGGVGAACALTGSDEDAFRVRRPGDEGAGHGPGDLRGSPAPQPLWRMSESTNPARVFGKSSGTMPRPRQPLASAPSMKRWTRGLRLSEFQRGGRYADVLT